MPAAKPARRRRNSAGTAMRRPAIAKARAGWARPGGAGCVAKTEPRPPLFDVFLGRNLARHVLGGEHPGAAAAFPVRIDRGAVRGAEGDEHDPDAGHGAEPADDRLAGYVNDVEERSEERR